MNKIERAIYDTKLQIKNLERENLIIESKLKAYKDIISESIIPQKNYILYINL